MTPRNRLGLWDLTTMRFKLVKNKLTKQPDRFNFLDHHL